MRNIAGVSSRREERKLWSCFCGARKAALNSGRNQIPGGSACSVHTGVEAPVQKMEIIYLSRDGNYTLSHSTAEISVHEQWSTAASQLSCWQSEELKAATQTWTGLCRGTQRIRSFQRTWCMDLLSTYFKIKVLLAGSVSKSAYRKSRSNCKYHLVL